MNSIHIYSAFEQYNGDMVTPVSFYSFIRSQHAESILFESSEYGDQENQFSYICYQPLFEIKVLASRILLLKGNEKLKEIALTPSLHLAHVMNELFSFFSFDTDLPQNLQPFFGGYIQYDLVQHLDKHTVQNPGIAQFNPPFIHLSLFSRVVVFDHFHQQIYDVSHCLSKPHTTSSYHLFNGGIPVHNNDFTTTGVESSPFKKIELEQMISEIKHHVYRGDVFQIVPSCSFTRTFSGDVFQIYRTLRSLNPSPYLFFCDYGSFSLFGSSPEAQLKIQNGRAIIHPIAGTVQRTGNHEIDKAAVDRLLHSEKENAEHIMLVDLARNDLSRNGKNVQVDRFREVQFYSHVIHLVSQVSAEIEEATKPWDIIFDTFPAGTLTGAPKFKAIEIIEKFEKTRRLFYGGAIGMVFLNGNTNLAIVIRSALAVRNKLYYQAGAGIVADSDPQSEVKEIIHKTNSMRSAIEITSRKER